jgi:hypothetical protein
MSNPMREFRGVDAGIFRREIAGVYRPAVLRGVVRDWPAVGEGLRSAGDLARYLAAFDGGTPVDAILTPPEARGRIFYDERMEGFNFLRRRLPIAQVIEQVLRYAHFDTPPAVAAQSAPVAQCLPGLLREHALPLLHPSIEPRIWLGNAIVTPAHFDESNNIACVVAGRRRFTLFPPEQARNLYIGPLDFAPTGTPISLVDMREPDYARHPRFREALAAAETAELDPGDAIYIPALWWHHVESLAPFNVLVNYWWKGAPDAPLEAGSMLDSLLHCLVNLSHVTAEQRRGWQALFECFVFDTDPDRAAHIPEHRRGLYGEIGAEQARRIREFLAAKLEA